MIGSASHMLTLENALMSAEPWVAVADLARHVGISHDTVCHWIDGKGLPAHKLGRLWKGKLSEVDDWGRAAGAVEGLSSEGGER